MLSVKQAIKVKMSDIYAPAPSDNIEMGFRDLDLMTSGLEPGSLNIVASRPKSGASSFVINIARWAALNQNKRVLIASFELSTEDITERLLAIDSGTDRSNLRNRRMTESYQADLERSADKLSALQLSIAHFDHPRFKLPKKTTAEAFDLIVIDGIGILASKARKQVLRSLNDHAKNGRAAVITTLTLSHELETRNNKRPRLADMPHLKLMDTLANRIFLIFREGLYRSAMTNRIEVEIAQQRNGPLGTCILHIDKNTGSIGED